VLLTKQIADYLKIDKPWCVMEGICSSETQSIQFENQNNKVILYTGTLHEKFGIMNLIAAFKKIENINYELIICGVGDCENQIKNIASFDSKIEFLGKLPREQVLELQKKATVLVNPRQNNEEFTKYSFPSKTLEYLSAGKPLVAYKLNGIPDEYDPYICYVKDNSIDCLANTLRKVCELPYIERYEIGKRGRDFVLDYKNSKVQVKKIIDLIESL
jgi:glycosyltransferase involved in cell wall biosynthesis